ncbi:universal stress protein [Nocardioides bigeumensis]|uniref:Universal stress protein n=1 Tax=Nocardioides bigeumensis TaxID=433657 RepID=A0ABN2Y5G1_9ACTN
MSTVHRDAIVVGVDGTPASLTALDYAVHEGRRIGAHLRLVHVVPSMSVMVPAPIMAFPPSDLEQRAHAILERAAKRARESASGLFVEAELAHGPRARALVDAAKDARMLVVGRDSRSMLDRLLLGDTMAGVAARAECPVVSVPAGWAPDLTTGLVVVGLKSLDRAEQLLADAFATASDHQARLLVVHAWRLPSAYDDIIASRVGEPKWDNRDTAALARLLEPFEAAHPEVELTSKVIHDYAAHALELAARNADLVILARRVIGFPPATHLGGTARHVLRTAPCPVRVVPPKPHEDHADEAPGRAGHTA